MNHDFTKVAIEKILCFYWLISADFGFINEDMDLKCHNLASPLRIPHRNFQQ